MATVTIDATGTPGMTVLDACEVITDWSNTPSGGGGWSAGTTNVIEGTNALERKMTAQVKGAWHDLGVGNELDFTVSGTHEDMHIWIWVAFSQPHYLDTLLNGGIRIRIGSTTSDFNDYYVEGNDTYFGGWKRVVVDPMKTPSAVGGSGADESSIRYVGIVFKPTNAPGGNDPNAFIDVMHVGEGYRVESTSGDATWQNIVEADMGVPNDTTKPHYGVLQLREGVYHQLGHLDMGDNVGTDTFQLKDSAQVIVYDTPYYYNSGQVQGVLDTFNQFHVVGNSTGTTNVEDGVKVGSGDTAVGSQGSLFLGTGSQVTWDLNGANVDNIKFYGSVLRNLTGTITLSANAGTTKEFIGCVTDGCGQIDPKTTVLRNDSFIGYTSSSGAAMLWNASIDVKNCSFLANADATNDPHAIEHPTDGTFAYIGMNFSGNDFDLNNTSVATLMDSYQPTEDGDVDVYSGSIIRVAQQFTATVGDLSRAIFSLRKQGAPTGVNVYARLYANSGGAPTGAVLAESIPIPIQDFTTSFADVEFEFEDEYTLAATDYHIAVEFAGGDASNRLEVEYLAAGAGGETCNTYISSWSGQTYDCRFAANRDGIVKINATSSNPGTAEETAATKGATIIVNTVNLKITVKDEALAPIQDVQTSIQLLASPFTQFMNEDTLATGVAEEPYNYTGDVQVVWKIRKSDDLDDPRYKADSGIETISDTGLNITVIMEEQPLPI